MNSPPYASSSSIPSKSPDIPMNSASTSSKTPQNTSSINLDNNMNIDTIDKLGTPSQVANKSYLTTLLSNNITPSTCTLSDLLHLPMVFNNEMEAPTSPNIFIPLSLEEKARIYKPWQHTFYKIVWSKDWTSTT